MYRSDGLTAPAVETPRLVYGAAVAGLGTAVPSTVVTNEAVASALDVEPRWIEQRTGIRERRVLAPGERLADLAADAARAALADAQAESADAVLLATCSPDDLIPALAPEVAGMLGIEGGALDVGAACTGFLACLDLGASMIEAGRAERVLVIGAEHLSAMLDPSDRGTAALFADGAGAVVLERTAAPGELGPVILRSEAQRDMLFATRHRGIVEMDGHEVFKHAVTRMSEATVDACAAAGTPLADVDLFVYHQANTRIVQAVGRRLGLDPERVVDCIAGVGNVSAASLPLALAAAREDGRLRPGARVLVSAFGAGFVWGAAVITW